MAKITYDNKVALGELPEIADVNKVKDSDMNEIKNVVNTNDDNVGDLNNLNASIKTSIVAAINSLNTYKLDTEIIIGYDADNDKLIYRYGHFISSLPNNATVTYDIGLTNVDKVIHCYGTCEDGYELNAVRPKGITSSIGAWYTTNNNRVNIETGVDRSSKSATVWVEYTKTN